jgi:hypothetical protein
MTKILVGVDGSERSEDAAGRAEHGRSPESARDECVGEWLADRRGALVPGQRAQ